MGGFDKETRMNRCDECQQRLAELERELALQKEIVAALVAVADKVIAERNVITDSAVIRDAFERDCI